MLVGNSLLDGIHADKLSREYQATTASAYTISQAQQVVKELQSQPQSIIFHLTTNDVKTLSTTDTVNQFTNLVSETQVKLPTAKGLISQASNNPSSDLSNHITANNIHLADIYKASPVTCINNSHIKAFTHDGIHLTHYDTSTLARSILVAVLPLP